MDEKRMLKAAAGRAASLLFCGLAVLGAEASWAGSPVRTVTPPKAAWSVRLKVDDYERNWKFSGTLLGQQAGAATAWDSQDLPAMAPFSSPYLYLTFARTDWGARSGDYVSDFRPAIVRAAGDWPFELRASSLGSTVYLRREGEAAILQRSLLIDKTSGSIYSGADPRFSGMGIPIRVRATSMKFVWRYLGP